MYVHVYLGLVENKPFSGGFANNTGADQPAHSRSLISAFVVRFMESTICKLATGKNLFFQLVSVAEENGLKLVFFFRSPKDRFLVARPIYEITVNGYTFTSS